MTELERIVAEMRRSFDRLVELVAPAVVTDELARLNEHLPADERVDPANPTLDVFVTRSGIIVFRAAGTFWRYVDGGSYRLRGDGMRERLERFEHGRQVRAVSRRRG